MSGSSFPDSDLLKGGPSDFAGMSAAEAKEYILALLSTLKLTEKEIRSLEEEAAKWKSRAELARSRGAADLAGEAEKEAEKVRARLGVLREEARSLKNNAEAIRKQLPALAARERSIDPDLLEQELLIAAGRMPGDEEKARQERQFEKLEKEASADAALEALKAKMKDTPL